MLQKQKVCYFQGRANLWIIYPRATDRFLILLYPAYYNKQILEYILKHEETFSVREFSKCAMFTTLVSRTSSSPKKRSSGNQQQQQQQN